MLRVESVRQLIGTEQRAVEDNEAHVVVGKRIAKSKMSGKRSRVIAASSTECTTMAFITKIASRNNM